jgi:glycosyltransferase involved in cell wall biosynthesis
MKLKLPSLLRRSQPRKIGTVSKPRALGVLLCYNDADILPEAIESLLGNNHELAVWDHGSNDGTAEVLDRYQSHFVAREFVPREFDFYKLYPTVSKQVRKNYSERYDWISWPDQDEILEGPARDRSYYEYLTEVVNSEYDWVQFLNFNFWFTEEDDPAVPVATRRIRRYSLFPDCSARIRAWRASVTNVREFNHNPLEGLPDPRPFRLRHYPMRTREQMIRRLEKDRANLERHGNNWHYNHMKSIFAQLLIPASALHFDDGHSELNPEPIFNWRAIYGHLPARDKSKK